MIADQNALSLDVDPVLTMAKMKEERKSVISTCKPVVNTPKPKPVEKKDEEVAKKEDEVVKKMDSAAKGNGSDDKESSPALVTSAASPGGSGEDAGAGAPPPSSLAEVLYIFGGSTMQVDSNDCYEIVVRNVSLLCPIVFIFLTDL